MSKAGLQSFPHPEESGSRLRRDAYLPALSVEMPSDSGMLPLPYCCTASPHVRVETGRAWTGRCLGNLDCHGVWWIIHDRAGDYPPNALFSVLSFDPTDMHVQTGSDTTRSMHWYHRLPTYHARAHARTPRPPLARPAREMPPTSCDVRVSTSAPLPTELTYGSVSLLPSSSRPPYAVESYPAAFAVSSHLHGSGATGWNDTALASPLPRGPAHTAHAAFIIPAIASLLLSTCTREIPASATTFPPGTGLHVRIPPLPRLRRPPAPTSTPAALESYRRPLSPCYLTL
ncbi:hypothetical protein C8J57DRAFT_1721331 [Mycena rebaudengoi]|nr:hypothetical protein C8J57DRAFT_1721331 [Mycena rebaudengoi]